MFTGGIRALPHVLVAARGQAGKDKRAWKGCCGCFALLWGIIPYQPLSLCLRKGVAHVTLSSLRGWQGWYAVSDCPSLQVTMPHQWLEGNLPVSARCAVCDRTCGSVRRLQDWRCLWCKAIVRMCPSLSPLPQHRQHCPCLGHHRPSGAASPSFACAHVPVSPGSQCLQGALRQEVSPGPVQGVHHPTDCLEQHRLRW